jgi:hypothetical protein
MRMRVMNVTELIAAVEERYWCMIGPPRAYFEIRTCNEPAHVLPLKYVELKAQVRGRLEENESFLCDWLSGAIGSPEEAGEWNRGPCLFWRLASKIEVDEQETTLDSIKFALGYKDDQHPTPKELWLKAKGEYEPSDLGWRSFIYTRLVICGRDLSEWITPEREKSRMLVRP